MEWLYLIFLQRLLQLLLYMISEEWLDLCCRNSLLLYFIIGIFLLLSFLNIVGSLFAILIFSSLSLGRGARLGRYIIIIFGNDCYKFFLYRFVSYILILNIILRNSIWYSHITIIVVYFGARLKIVRYFIFFVENNFVRSE